MFILTPAPLPKIIVREESAKTPADRAWEGLDRLAGELSPENLCCDGELRGAALRTKHRRLLKEWAAHEAVIGRKVSETEIWDRFYKRSR